MSIHSRIKAPFNFESEFFTSNKCPVCGNGHRSKVFSFRYKADVVLEKIGVQPPYPAVSTWRCEECGHCYASPILKPEKLMDYYAKLNSVFYKDDSSTNMVDPLDPEHARVCKQLSELTQPGRVLEIGCGKGFLLKKLFAGGWETHGVEPSRVASRFASEVLGLDVKQQFLDFEAYKPASFDAILMFDVVEHLPSMAEMMELVKYYLKPDGLFVFGTGNFDSLNAKINGSTWSYFGSWEHISFFSPKSVNSLLGKFDFEPIQILFHSHSGGFRQNCLRFAANVLFNRPLNVVLPTVFAIFPLIRKTPGISHRSMSKTNVVVSYLAFDHLTVYSRLC